VLDYADVVDLHGGSIDDAKNVTWPKTTIPGHSTVGKQITVRIKNPISATPTGASDPGHFDLTMTNVFGNVVTVKLPSPPTKTIETTAAALPNTGPGTSLLVAAGLVIVATYFYSRARLLSQESAIALRETAGV